jgi:hypothetical protein
MLGLDRRDMHAQDRAVDVGRVHDAKSYHIRCAEALKRPLARNSI